jgi:hypothetical protein
MKQYLIAHVAHTTKGHEHIMWWNPECRGYTVCIDKAGLYDEKESRDNCCHGTCIAVPKDAAEPLARSTPYYRRANGTLNKLYDGGPHRVIPNSAEAWRLLFAVRYDCDVRPGAPTPISAKKSRAVYIDNIDEIKT